MHRPAQRHLGGYSVFEGNHMLIHRLAAQLYTDEALQAIDAALDAGEDATLAVSQSARALMVAAQFAHKPRATVYIVSGEEAADRAARALIAYVGADHVARFPERTDYPWKSSQPDDAVDRKSVV